MEPNYLSAKILYAIDLMGGVATFDEIYEICKREVPFEDELIILQIAENLRQRYAEIEDGPTG